MKIKKIQIQLQELAHLFKGQDEIQEFVKLFSDLQENSPESIIVLLNDDEHVCNFTFHFPADWKKSVPQHRHIEASWEPSQD